MGPPPQPAKPKDDNCATAVAAPSFSSSRRVKFPMAGVLDALSEAKVGPRGKNYDPGELPTLGSFLRGCECSGDFAVSYP